MTARSKILVVDDEERNLRLIEAILTPLDHDVITARDGAEAIERAQKDSPDLILLDVMMPVTDGFEVVRHLKSGKDTMIIPVVMITSLNDVDDRVKALDAGADDFLSKPVDSVELIATVNSQLKVKAYYDHMLNYQNELETEVSRRTEQLHIAFEKIKTSSLETIFCLSRAAEYKDEETGSHIKRMSNYTYAIARKMQLDPEISEMLLYAAPMHDVGKIGIPEHILLKPGRLDENEWEIMKQHTVIGAQILQGSDSDHIRMAETIALTHHEKWDGSGYPEGLKGNDIPLVGRITAISDVFDALTSKRPYKEAFMLESAFAIIREGRGSHFDPEIVDAFFDIQEELLKIRATWFD